MRRHGHILDPSWASGHICALALAIGTGSGDIGGGSSNIPDGDGISGHAPAQDPSDV